MTFRGDDRAVSTVVGAVLIFGVLILALGVYQAQIVPADNAQVEYRHSQNVQQDLQELRNSLVGAASTGSGAPVSVKLGTRYPLRTFAVNPPPVYGELESVPLSEASEIRIGNISATDDETDDYLSGTLTFATKGLAYEASYNQYRNAPTAVRYEHGTLYNDYEAADLNLTAGLLVDGRKITVVVLNASDRFSKSGIEAASVDPKSLSAPYRATKVENSDSGNLTLTLPTNASRQYWVDMYEGRANVADVSLSETPSGNVTTVEFENGTYDLRMAAVGVGESLEQPEPKYLTVVSGNGTDSVTVEVRDRYNNPVSWTVNATEPGLFKAGTQDTGSDGQAVFAVKPGVPETDTTFEILDNSSVREYVNVTVGSSGGAGENATYDVNLTATELNCGSTDECTLRVSSDGTSTPLRTNVTSDNGDLTEASVDYALNNSSFGTLGTTEAVTDAGTHTTSISGLDTNGTVAVYAASGDGSDSLTIRVVTSSGSSDPITFKNYQDFQADALNDEFTVGQIQIQDNDGDLDRVEYKVRNSSGALVATRTDAASGQQYQVQNYLVNGSVSVADGETYTMTVTGYDSDGDFVTESRSDTTPTYDVTINSASAASGNSMNVEFEVTTSDSNAHVEVVSLRNGNVRDSTTVRVAASQPQTVTIDGANQADQVRVILYDGDPSAGGTERERTTVPYPYP